MKDIIGLVYGNLTVISFSHKKGSNYFWRCKCVCGNECSATYGNLHYGRQSSCGCRRYPDLVGNRYNRLVVIGRVKEGIEIKYTSRAYWKCQCDCGKETIVRGSHLKTGEIKSCGCLKLENPPPLHLKLNNEGPKNRFLLEYKSGAKQRNLSWNITDEYALDLSNQNCFYCDAEPTEHIASKRRINWVERFYCNGIDRKNNSVGYELDNVVSCCKDCNMAKRSMDYDRWIWWLDNIVKYRGKLNEN